MKPASDRVQLALNVIAKAKVGSEEAKWMQRWVAWAVDLQNEKRPSKQPPIVHLEWPQGR